MENLEEPRLAYRVFWSDEDAEYVAICEQYPSLSWLADDPVEALSNLVKLISNDEDRAFHQAVRARRGQARAQDIFDAHPELQAAVDHAEAHPESMVRRPPPQARD